MARRSALTLALLSLAVFLLAVPSANAALKLPPGAGAAPKLPPGVVPASGAPRPLASAATSVASAAGKRFRVYEGPPPLWATVNICDTDRSPNALGVRTSVPGDSSGKQVYARYTAQWWSRDKQAWLSVRGAGRTGWNFVGRQGPDADQAGWTFRFSQPPAGTTYVIRGVVELSWRDQVQASRKRQRARTSVVRRQVLLTETGKERVGGGDPTGTSKAMCLIW